MDDVRTEPGGAAVLDSPAAGAATVRGGATRGGAWIAGAALSLVSIPLLVRHLGVADFGRYIAVLSIVNVAALASDLGIGALALREWSASEGQARVDVLRSLLGLRIVAASLGAVAAIAFALAAGYPGRVVAGTALAAVGLFAQVFGDFALVVLAGSLRFGRVALVELTRSALGTIGIVVLVVAGAGLVPFFAAYSLAAVCAAILALGLARRDTAIAGGVPGVRREAGVALRPRMSIAAWRPLIADTAAYAAATAVYVVYFRAIMLVVSLDASARQAGLFAGAYRLIEFAAAVAGVLAATVTPVLARAAARDSQRLRRAGTAVARTGIVAGAFAALVLGLGAPTLMDVIGGNRIDAAVPVLRIEAAAVATTFAAFSVGAVLLVLRRYRDLLVVNACALAVALAAALVLVPSHGARGGAIAAVAGEAVLVVGQLTALVRALPLARALARPALVAALAAGLAIAIFAVLPGPNVVATAIAGAVYVAVVAALRELPPELAALRRRRVA